MSSLDLKYRQNLLVLVWSGFSLCLGCVLAGCGDQTVTPNPVSIEYTAQALATVKAAKIDPQKIKLQLEEAWDSYKHRFIQADGRVMDLSAQTVTTSEGQSYALLRAVWSDDQEVFKRVLQWSQVNLQRRDSDKLFAYKWGKAEDGSWKILDKGAATDADTDIALALIFASHRWSDSTYQKMALEVLASLWEHTLVTVKGKTYSSAGDWATAKEQPTLNPSYMAPYAYRIFAVADPAHKWASLIDPAYEVVVGSSLAEFGGQPSVKLPPNWCSLDKQTGQFGVSQDFPRQDTNFGYDAFRTMWRLSLDYKWFGDKRALDYLRQSSFLRETWRREGKLVAIYDHTGKVVDGREDLAAYSGALANFALADPPLAESLVQTKLLPTFRHGNAQESTQDYTGWGDPNNYYNQNWVWFSLALYSDNLPNLAASKS